MYLMYATRLWPSGPIINYRFMLQIKIREKINILKSIANNDSWTLIFLLFPYDNSKLRKFMISFIVGYQFSVS